MNEINRILIIGAGNRVVNDVIPALGAIDFNLSKIMHFVLDTLKYNKVSHSIL